MELRKRYVVASHNIAASILQQNSSSLIKWLCKLMPSVTWLFLLFKLFHLYVLLVGYCYAPLKNEVLTGVGSNTKWKRKQSTGK